MEERFALGWRDYSFALSDLLPQTSLRAVGPTGPEANLQHLFCLLAPAPTSKIGIIRIQLTTDNLEES